MPAARFLTPLFAASLLAALGLAFAAPPVKPNGKESDRPPVKEDAGTVVEVRFTDGGILKLTLREDKIPLKTPYGKLLIPVADVHRIEFASRNPAALGRRIAAAIEDLGSAEFARRQAASTELRKIGPRAYPALLLAVKNKDREVSKRAEELLGQLRNKVPEAQLVVRKDDVVYTADSKITGRIEGEALKALTAQFGEVQLKLSDVRSLRSGASRTAVGKVEEGPQNLIHLQGEVGKTFRFRVTGAIVGVVYGTRVYTSDSSLATAAVHAGALRPGQTGIVRVKIVPAPPGFVGSTQNGVTSSPYGAWPGAYEILR